MTDFEVEIKHQEARMVLLSQACDALRDKAIESVTRSEVQTRLGILDANWNKFDKGHEDICKAKYETIQDLPYISDDYYSIAQEAYITSKSTLLNLLESITGNMNNINRPNSADNSFSSSIQRPLLPKISLPQFAGDYQSWTPFCDLFTSLVIENPDISNVAKMHYLKNSLVKDAAHLISNFQISGENFPLAWEKLRSRYENKRVLIHKHLEDIFKLKPINRKSARNLSGLISVINESLGSLKALGLPTDQWDQIIVYIIVNRLDAETHESWEVHQGASVEPPALQDLLNFIDGRVRALENIESRESCHSGSMHSAKSQGNYHRATTHASLVDIKSNISCPLCKENHYLSNCKVFYQKLPIHRKEYIISQKLCFNCLGNHHLKECRSQKTCLKCRKRHHTLIHGANQAPLTNMNAGSVDHSQSVSHVVEYLPSTEDRNTNPLSSVSETTLAHHAMPNTNKNVVLLATAQVKVIGPNQNVITARALIDQGSEISFISEHLTQSLHLPRSAASISLIGVGGNQSATTRGKTSAIIGSIYDATVKCNLTAYILPKLTTLLPSQKAPQSNWPHIEGIELADPTFMTPGNIDLILGADIYGKIILPNLIQGPSLTPIAQSTVFGWILSGPTGSIHEYRTNNSFHCKPNGDVNDLLERFWVQEEISPITQPVLSNSENEQCEEHFKSNVRRIESGRYEVKLPLKESADTLGNSRTSAYNMLQSSQSRMTKDPEYKRLYSDFIHEYENLDHMSEVLPTTLETKPVFYLPHHGVLRSHSSSTKLRVVFNASHPTSSGKSLNDILHSGPKLQTNLPDVITWFRRFKYVFVADIEKMYRQILVHEDDWNLQRILWLENGELHTYQLKTVTYGLACAPFLALRTIQHLINDEREMYPLAVETLERGRYVDDVFGGSETVDSCVELSKQVDGLCKAGCFPLKKWISNDPAVLREIPLAHQEHGGLLPLDSSPIVRVLGLSWKPLSDDFQFLPDISPVQNVTKRNVLSRIAQFFDPLGFIAPIIIQAKIFMQKLWLVKLSWDDTLPSDLIAQWKKFELQLQDLPAITIPRYLGLYQSSHVELHGFSDASMSAMSAVIYIRVTNGTSNHVSFVCSKTKVAPLKKMTIPRLELTAASMLVKLANYASKLLDLTDTPIWLWIDSSVALTWITNPPSKWKEFVSNRVNFIQEQQPKAIWRFIPGKENPADCASRGMSPTALIKHPLWWNGPEWLSQDHCHWPSLSYVTSNEAYKEERTAKLSYVVVQPVTEYELLQRYSNLLRLLRITAWCKKFIDHLKCRHSANETSQTKPYLTPTDLQSSLTCLIKHCQSKSFKDEVKLLNMNKIVSNTSPLRNLNPFIDQNGLLRVGGRLENSLLDYDAKHPYILPKNSALSMLIIKDAHLRSLHSSTSNTQATVRQQFWILGGRPIIRKELLRCVICARYRAIRAQQLMGQLPPSRILPSRPFLHSGVDYAGPFIIKTWRGRAAKTYKSYIALFVCSSTSAIHLELVTDYTADAFIAAYKRFTSRRGICATLTSDCGTTFVGANTELKRMFSSSSSELGKLRNLLANDGTLWKFNPPAAPHFGGHWEAGVKSVKYHIKRVIGNVMLTYEEFSTVLIQIEAVLNSRPICKLTEDPDDLSTLTPGHFLCGGPLTIIPEENLSQLPISRLSRWKLTRQMLESFWKRWSRQYLQQLQAIYKWRFPSSSIEEGSIVLITDEQHPPAKWPLAKVVKLHPGEDNLVRVVTLKSAAGEVKRPISKLCVLPVADV